MSVEMALDKVLSSAQPTQKLPETVYLEQALGRVLAEDIIATISVPPANNSSMDGYAVAVEDIEPDAVYAISQRITAGQSPSVLEPGTVARIFTGAELPSGANGVVPQESAVVESDGQVRFSERPLVHQWVRAKGQDVSPGQCVCPAGTRLRPADIAMIASVGVDSVAVKPALLIGVVSTGDELINPGDPLPSGKIYNSNRYLLTGLIEQLGMSVVSFHCEDTYEATVAALADASEQCDVVISTGGVSVGEEDHIRDAVNALGELSFWRIALKPGKPFAFGQIKSSPFFGLPGNPVSVLITFAVFVRPFLALHSGGALPNVTVYPLPIGFSVKTGIRQEYVRVRFQKGKLLAYSNQNSGVLSSIQWADGVVVVPPHTSYDEGALVDFVPFDQWLMG
jgi:molybdopterin molybdotransferase